jgi:hypothetical protein
MCVVEHSTYHTKRGQIAAVNAQGDNMTTTKFRSLQVGDHVIVKAAKSRTLCGGTDNAALTGAGVVINKRALSPSSLRSPTLYAVKMETFDGHTAVAVRTAQQLVNASAALERLGEELQAAADRGAFDEIVGDAFTPKPCSLCGRVDCDRRHHA